MSPISHNYGQKQTTRIKTLRKTKHPGTQNTPPRGSEPSERSGFLMPQIHHPTLRGGESLQRKHAETICHQRYGRECCSGRFDDRQTRGSLGSLHRLLVAEEEANTTLQRDYGTIRSPDVIYIGESYTTVKSERYVVTSGRV